MLARIKDWLIPPRADSPMAVSDLLAEEAARLSQRATTGFCHLKAAGNAHLLFKEATFLEALEVCRWNGFALILADLAMVLEGFLRPPSDSAKERLWVWLEGVYSRILTRQDTGHDFAEALRAFHERLGHARLAPPGPAQDQVALSCQRIYDSLPIHESLRGDDLEVISGLIRFGAVTFRETLERRCDPEKIIDGLNAP